MKTQPDPQIKFRVLTLFPEMIRQGLESSVIGRAMEKNMISLETVNIRDYTLDRHGGVDDYPYGGGAGMLMQAQPVFDAWRAAAGDRKVRTIYVTPQGIPFSQSMAQEFAGERELIFLCGHYEGIDERVLEEVVTDYVSIGDYILTGGELPAMVMIDAVARLIPGVLGNEASAEDESFYNDLLEYPQYSRPEVWHGKRVPEVLLSGNHGSVAKWRLSESEKRTAQRRPDLYQKYQQKQDLIRELARDRRNNIHMIESLSRGWGEILCREGKNILIYDRKSKVGMVQAADAASAERIAAMVPEDTELVMSTQEEMNRALEERGFVMDCATWQFLYTEKVPLPVKHRDIRKLDLSYLDAVSARQEHNDRRYIKICLELGNLYGAFVGDELVGFAGMHREGSLGLLYVEEAYRKEGLAASLEAFTINKTMEKGWTPYGHVVCGNEASERLQEKLGLYRAKKTVWWLERGKKVLASGG